MPSILDGSLQHFEKKEVMQLHMKDSMHANFMEKGF